MGNMISCLFSLPEAKYEIWLKLFHNACQVACDFSLADIISDTTES